MTGNSYSYSEAGQGTSYPSNEQGRSFSAIDFLSQSGITFVKIRRGQKAPIENDWQLKPLPADVARQIVTSGWSVGAHCGANSANLIMIDVDCESHLIFDAFPTLATLPYIYRENAPSVKLLVHSDSPLPNASFTTIWPNPDKPGKFHHFHMLSTGKQGVIPPSGHPSGVPYCLNPNGHTFVPTWSAADIMAIWDTMKGQFEKPKEARNTPKKHTPSPRRRRPATVKPQIVASGQDFDWPGFVDDVLARFDLEGYAIAEFGSNTRREKDGQLKIRGNGGLFVKGDQWFCFKDDVGGGPFELIAYKLNGNTNTKADWANILKVAADFAGVAWPVFETKRVNGKPYSWPTFQADQTLHLAQGQYVSDVLDLDKLAWGECHSIESGTGSGKSYACYKQLKHVIHAVPLVGQVKQFSKKYGSKPIYAGHKLDKSAWQHTTTYDGLHKFVRAHNEGEFDLSRFTFVEDECHHEAIDGYKDPETFHTMRKVAAMCGRHIRLSGTMPPLSVSAAGNTIKITRDEIIKPFSYTESTMPTDTITRIFDLEIEAGRAKPLMWVHLNDKNMGAAYVADLAKVRQELKAICLNKQTEEDGDPHHTRITDGDGFIADDIDIVFVTSIFDDAVDIFANRPVIHVVISLLPPLSIEQSGARYRGNLPQHTYIMRVVGRKKPAKKAKPAKVETFHLLDELDREIQRLEHHKALIKQMLDYDANVNDQPLESIARNLIAEPLLKFFTIKGNSIEIDKVKLIQSLTAKWAGYCKREMDAMADALAQYGYQYMGVAHFAEKANAKTRKKAIQADKQAKREEANERVRQAAKDIESLPEAENLVINAGSKTRKNAEYKAAKTMLAVFDSGLTFEAAKTYTENAASFNKKTVGKHGKRIQAATCYQMLKAGAVPTGPSSRFLSMLFKWLERKKQADERVSPALWADALLYAANATGQSIARARFFDPKRSDKALVDERGSFLRMLADVKLIRARKNSEYQILNTELVSDTDLRISDLLAKNSEMSNSKTAVLSEKDDVLLFDNQQKQADSPVQAAFSEFILYDDPDDVRNEDAFPTLPSEPDWSDVRVTDDDLLSDEAYRLAQSGQFEEAKEQAAMIKNYAQRMRVIRYIAACKKNEAYQKAA